jgi:hypothetical protein|tara:strand:- start:547 stop:732 length:186 start_codon:yes stop_codon:yes gene_type:complete
MDKLKDHIIVIEGVEYIPLSIAMEAVTHVATINPKLDEATKAIKDAIKGMNNTLNKALEDD